MADRDFDPTRLLMEDWRDPKALAQELYVGLTRRAVATARNTVSQLRAQRAAGRERPASPASFSSLGHRGPASESAAPRQATVAQPLPERLRPRYPEADSVRPRTEWIVPHSFGHVEVIQSPFHPVSASLPVDHPLPRQATVAQDLLLPTPVIPPGPEIPTLPAQDRSFPRTTPYFLAPEPVNQARQMGDVSLPALLPAPRQATVAQDLGSAFAVALPLTPEPTAPPRARSPWEPSAPDVEPPDLVELPEPVESSELTPYRNYAEGLGGPPEGFDVEMTEIPREELKRMQVWLGYVTGGSANLWTVTIYADGPDYTNSDGQDQGVTVKVLNIDPANTNAFVPVGDWIGPIYQVPDETGAGKDDTYYYLPTQMVGVAVAPVGGIPARTNATTPGKATCQVYMNFNGTTLSVQQSGVVFNTTATAVTANATIQVKTAYGSLFIDVEDC
jgi:hypothetical protein